MKGKINRDKSHKCITCGIDINLLYSEDAIHRDFRPESAMWSGGVVDKIAAGYGSSLDGDIFLIAVCDGCIKSNAAIKHIGNYF